MKADVIGDDVVFDLAGTVKSFQAGTYSSGTLRAEAIGQVKIKQGGLGADVEALTGDIAGIGQG